MAIQFRRVFVSVLFVGVALLPDCLLAGEKTTSIHLDSEILGERREILISLPDSYQHTQRDYPLLVTTDAELIHEFASGTALYLARQGKAPELIVVGIVNTDREKNLYYETDNFIAFTEDELIPFVDDRYRSSGLRALFGFSSGTVPVDSLLFANSDLFSLYISAGWGMSDAGYQRLSESLPDQPFSGQRVYLSTEGNTVRRKNVENLLADLERIAPDNLDWKGYIYEGRDHGDVMTRGLQDGLEFLFRDWALPAARAAEGRRGLDTHEQSLRDTFSMPVALQSEAIAGAAFALLHTGDDDEATTAVTLLEEAVRRKPWAADMLAYLAYAQWQAKDHDTAQRTLRSAISLAKETADPRLAEYRNWLSDWQASQ